MMLHSRRVRDVLAHHGIRRPFGRRWHGGLAFSAPVLERTSARSPSFPSSAGPGHEPVHGHETPEDPTSRCSASRGCLRDLIVEAPRDVEPPSRDVDRPSLRLRSPIVAAPRKPGSPGLTINPRVDELRHDRDCDLNVRVPSYGSGVGVMATSRHWALRVPSGYPRACFGRRARGCPGVHPRRRRRRDRSRSHRRLPIAPFTRPHWPWHHGSPHRPPLWLSLYRRSAANPGPRTRD
jgi:hypothetical protein